MSQFSQNEVVIFLHLAKTAGSTMFDIVQRQYEPHDIYTVGYTSEITERTFRVLSEAERGKYPLVNGHMRFGLHEYIPRPCRYFTVLRDPVERIVSYYYFIQRAPKHHSHDRIMVEGMSLQEWVACDDFWELDNGQMRIMCADEDVPVGGCTEDMLRRAKENLAQEFAVVGLTERFDETLLLLRREFGWKELFYKRRNVTATRPTVADVPQAAIDAIVERNWMDIEMYRFAQELFDEQVKKAGRLFQLELVWFERQNTFFQEHGSFSLMQALENRYGTRSLRVFLQNKVGEMLRK